MLWLADKKSKQEKEEKIITGRLLRLLRFCVALVLFSFRILSFKARISKKLFFFEEKNFEGGKIGGGEFCVLEEKVYTVLRSSFSEKLEAY